MEISKELNEKICKMSDKEISDAVKTVADILGANNSTARMLADNPGFVRKKIKNVSNEDIEKMKRNIKQDDINAILGLLGLNSDKGR